jgi:hypothetical protein
LTYTIGGLGLVNGDTLSGALATTATPVSPLGSYPILIGSLTSSSNYTLSYFGATLTIQIPPLQTLSSFLNKPAASGRSFGASKRPPKPSSASTVAQDYNTSGDAIIVDCLADGKVGCWTGISGGLN